MKKLLLISLMLVSVNALAWNPFEQKKSSVRKIYNKASELLAPFAPIGIQIVGGVVLPVTAAFLMKDNHEEYSNFEKVCVRSALCATAASTGLNVYQLYQSGKNKKKYDNRSIAYATINQLAIFATLYGLHKLDVPFGREFGRK